jgi:hypothetical protein
MRCKASLLVMSPGPAMMDGGIVCHAGLRTALVVRFMVEALNIKNMAIKRKACGYRNVENCKAAICFSCGGLEVYPRSV